MQLLPNIKQFFVDSNGDPLVGGKLYSYLATTVTLTATYTDAGGLTQNANPLILDANGQGEVWIDPAVSYKFVLKDANDVVQFTRDNVVWIPALSISAAKLAANAVTTAKILDGNVTTAKIADANITTVKIADSNVTTAKINDEAVTAAKMLAGVGLVPAGTILAYGGTAAPTGFLLCNGTSYLRATYPALYTAIGNAFGTADATHFNVPDFRGRFLRGKDGATARDPDAAGRTAMNTGGGTGDNVGSVQDDEFESHTHTLLIATANGNGTNALGSNNAVSTSNAGANQTAGGSSETRPKNAYVNFIIKT